MLFSSFTFIFAFLPIVWIVFHLLKKVRFKSHYTIAKIFLIVSSLFFYAFWKVAYLPILLSSIVVNYTLAKLILKSNSACSDFLGSASAHSLQRTPSAPHSFASHNPKNSSTILEFAKYKDLLSSKTNAMTLGGGNHYLDSSASHDSNADVSSLRELRVDSWQSTTYRHSEGAKRPKNPRIANDILLDSSLHASRSAQNDENDLDLSPNLKNDKYFVDCFGDKSPRNDERDESPYKSHNSNIRFTPKFYFIVGIIFNLCLLGFFKYTDFLLENFNAFSKLAHLDFDIPLPHILLPLALSFVTFQQIAFLFDCYKRTKGELDENLHIDFVDYALFISFFPQLIAGPIVHHREMMPQFYALGNANSSHSDFSRFHESRSLQRTPSASHSLDSQKRKNSSAILEFAFSNGNTKSNNPSLRVQQHKAIQKAKIDCHDLPKASLAMTSRCPSLRGESMDSPKQSTINYEFLAKGIFIFSIGLFKKVFIADSFAKWANAGFGVVEKGGFLNIAESWATSLSYTFQLYFDFSGYCDMAMGLALMFGIVLPLNFDSPYKSLNIAEFWRRWHITLGRFLKECLYIPLGGNRVSKILNLRNLFIVAFLSGIWHGAGWGFVIWGVLHGVAMVIHRIYAWILERNSSLGNKIFCHTERSEVSKSSEFQINNESMTQERIDKSHRFTQSKQIANDSKVAKMDSSLHALRSAQNDGVESNHDLCGSIFGRFCGFSSARRGNRTNASIDEAKREESRKSVKKTNALYKFLCWFITFNFINIAWIFFRSENLNGAVNLIKGMFGVVWVELPQKLHRIPEVLAQIGGRNDTIFYIIIAFIVCLACKNSFEMLKNFDTQHLRFHLALRIFSKKIYIKGGAVFTRFVLTIALFYIAIWAMLSNLLDSNAYTPFLYFNF